MTFFIRAYRLINLLSIDIAAGAMICAAFFAKVFDAQLRSFGLAALGVTVWIIYTVDHLLDTRKLKSAASSERHRLHQQHNKTLWLLVFLAVVADAVLIAFIRTPVLLRGIMLSGVVVVYLLVQRYLRVLKEWVAAILYAGGVLLPPVVISPIQFSPQHHALIFSFFMTAWINLLMFAWFGRNEDRQDDHRSFVTAMGEPLTVIIIWIQLIANGGVLMSVLILSGGEWMPVAIVAAMNAVLAIVFFKRTHFAVNDRYRLLGDAVFLIPAIYLIA